jgi:hypothetical protein
MRRSRLVTVIAAIIIAPGAVFSVAAREKPQDEESQPERSEADLMMDALTDARVEAPNATQIARLTAEANAESRLQKIAAATAAVRYWRDPFADNPNQAIPLGARVRLSMQLAAARREAAHARAETALARAEAAVARAEVARARAGTLTARRAVETERGRCTDVAMTERPSSASSMSAPVDEVARRERLRRAAAHRARQLKTALAQNERRETAQERSARLDKSAAAGSGGADTSHESPPPSAPAAASSSDPRGIVIVPINSPASAPAATRAR